MIVRVDGHRIEVETSGSYDSGGPHQPQSYPNFTIVDDLPEEVRRASVIDAAKEEVREEVNKSDWQRKQEHKASKL